MSAISVNPVETTITQMSVFWSQPTMGEEIGDSALTTFHLQWDKNTGGDTDSDWFDLVGYPIDAITDNFIVGSNVAGGYMYKFRVRAGNIYGFGDWSDISEFKAS